MEVQISPQTIAQIDELVAQGGYPSQAAVIDEAIGVGLDLLRRRSELQSDLLTSRAGLDAGRGYLLDDDDQLKEFMRRIAEGESIEEFYVSGNG